jgi:hypothetical protein
MNKCTQLGSTTDETTTFLSQKLKPTLFEYEEEEDL